MNFIFLKSESGSAILISLSISAILIATSLISLGLTKSLSYENSKSKYKNALTEIRNTVMGELDSDANWEYQVAVNNTTSCLRNDAAICASGAHQILRLTKPPDLVGATTSTEIITRIYQQYLNRSPEPAGLGYWIAHLNSGMPLVQIIREFVNSSEANRVLPTVGVNGQAGYKIDGSACYNFGSATGDECPFRLELTWECETGGVSSPCPATIFPVGTVVALEPRIRLRGRFLFKPRNPTFDSAINLDTMQINFIRGTDSKTLSRFCNTIKGRFNQATRTCGAYMDGPDAVDCSVSLGRPPINIAGIDYHIVKFAGFVTNPSTGATTPICDLDEKLDSYCGAGTAVHRVRPNGTLDCGVF
jgi:hypothetical protein